MTTTIADMIAQLETMDPETQVLVASDEEGNSFHHLAAFGVGYIPKTDEPEYEPDILDLDDEDNDWLPDEVTPVLIIWP